MGATNMVDSNGARRQLGKRLGKRIADRRKAIAWTQEQLAERVGVDAETISRFERGATVPSLNTLDQIAKVLKSRTADLLSAASTEPTDQAIRISAWLEGIGPRDREFVVEHVKKLCDQFRKRD
jgi:transcriptional regulator with XRE-family HTH domain